ncbi:probable DNA double-strand break repair Rad50 ATPase [Mytilus edulis]|uniref:probable DNA double-strand break repair Rad50 ATPase n=1 Tax=Mytilus edulis TaxID=6550 RepID=UPI0039EE6CB5
MRNSAFIQHLDIANVLKIELKGVKSKLSEEKWKNSEQQQHIQDFTFQLNHLESVKYERDQFKQELANISKHKEESASRLNVQEYVNQIQELKDRVIEKDKTVKMVQDLYFMRSTEFTDEIETLKNEKSDLHSKLQSQENSVKQLTKELQSLRHENYMLSSSQHQQRPNYNNRHYNNRRGGRFR